MAQDPDAEQIAAALLMSIRLLVQRSRQTSTGGDLTLPERSALARLDGGGPATSSELAKLEQIRPQSMGATLGALQARGLIERHPDPADGRRVVLSVTDEGREVLRTRRDARASALAQVLQHGFTRTELKQLMAAAPLIERLAHGI